ncbi:unnamed protein product, partial [Brassica napus]
MSTIFSGHRTLCCLTELLIGSPILMVLSGRQHVSPRFQPHLSDCYKPTLFTTEPPLFSTKTGSTTYRSTMASPNPLNSPPPRYGLRLTLCL